MLTTIFEIWAVGSKHKAYLKINEKIYAISISKEDYIYLKKMGVPTAQSRRYKK